MSSRNQNAGVLVTGALVLSLAVIVAAQSASKPEPSAGTNYVLGANDVVTVTSYDQADLSGHFTIEADGSFTYPLVGRVKAIGLTARELETQLKSQLKDGGFFNNPQIAVAVEQYKSQRIFINGEVRMPGSYPLSGDMTLVEALARAGSTLPTSSGEVIIVHASTGSRASAGGTDGSGDDSAMIRINVRDLENGVALENIALRDGDRIFVTRAASIYIFGQVKNPNAYPLQQPNTTVLQALALAGGLTDRGSQTRIDIVRLVNGEKKTIRVKLSDLVKPDDTIIVRERFF